MKDIIDMEHIHNYNDQGELDGGWSVLEGDVEGAIRRALSSGFYAWDSTHLDVVEVFGNDQNDLEVRFQAHFCNQGKKDLYIQGVARAYSSLRAVTNSHTGKSGAKLYSYIQVYWELKGES